MSLSSRLLNLRSHAVPWVSAISIAVGAMVALPTAAMAGFGNELTHPAQHSCPAPAAKPACKADNLHARGQTGTVTGTVQLLACGGPPPPPGITPRPCIFQPVAGAEIDLNAGGRTVTSALTDSHGRYSARVKAGMYTVRIALPLTLASLGAPQTVNVRPRALVESDFRLTFWAF